MIEIKNVYKTFNKNTVLNNLSLEVKSGEIYGILVLQQIMILTKNLDLK